MSNRLLGIASQVLVMAIVISVIFLFLGVGVLVLIHVCIVGRALRRGLSTTRGNNGCDNNNGLSHDDLQSLPCFDYMAGEKGSSPVDCAVCLEGFQMGDKCRLLPVCKHSFHAHCVDLWLLKSPICPICRTTAGSSQGGKVSGDGLDHLGVVSFELGATQPVAVGFSVSSSSTPLHSPPVVSRDHDDPPPSPSD